MALLCCRCGRAIRESAVPPAHADSGPAAYGRTCARILGLLPEPDLLKPKRLITVKREAKPDTRQLRFPL